MLYSPERSSLASTDPTGSAHAGKIFPAGVISGKRHTLHGVKDENGSSMGRVYKTISRLSISPRRVYQGRALPALLLCGIASLCATTAHAQSAAKWDKRGQDAEARQDFDAAYEDYHNAVLKKPKDLRFLEHFQKMRYQAAVAHVDRGRVLRQNGDIQGAMAQFNRALQIDSGNQAAEQEINQIQREQQVERDNTPQAKEQMSRQNETLSTLGSIAGPVELKPVSNDPITLHMVEDVKVIYEAIGKAAGLNVLFDPDYSSKRIPVDLTNVTLSDALRIVGTISGTFYKAITPNTIFVATNSRTKRTDLDEQAVQTFYLTNASQQNDANEVVIAIRNLLDPSVKIYLVPSQNAIVMRATPDQLLLAQKLLNDLDRARPEVVVDVAVLEVNKNVEHNLGITLPQSITLTPQANPNTTSSSSSSSSGTGTGTGTGTTSNFTLNTLAHLNANNFAVGITGGTLNALLTDADTRVLQNPSIRATDGQRATMKIGEKIPVATGSYNAGVSTGVASIGVQTQFTYLDIGVNIDMTPTVHYDREVTLKMKIEVLSQVTTVNISGVNEPVIGQRTSEQVITLKDGEPSLLAGIITKNDALNIAGTPGIGELPFFKYFFTSRDKINDKQEIVFIIIPHIVRESVLTRANVRPIDTGTGQSIELRRDASANDSDSEPIYPNKPHTPASPTSAANAASTMVQQLSQQAAPVAPPANYVPGAQTPATQPPATPQAATQTPAVQTPATPTVGGPPVSFTVVPPDSNQPVGSTFQVAVMLGNGRDVFSVPLQLQFNPALLQLVNVDAGDFLGKDGQAVSLVHREDNGLVAISSIRPPNTAGVSGTGSLCTLTFKAIAPGDSTLSLVKVGALNSAQANLPAVGSQATVHVK
ncbi:cohesin domain-containing protein [Tunturiibacter empetritectus]|uniref:General secretion pathway protein D n=1 Tax=Tunturiibacter lichenicola TaxID=2051959 RepID=A0A852VJ00_9BACT|nr:cohesin domain-containing protein [Edaphobacter lichenicola]NYF89486.1 general secretion pathway protein D [Edaphobacter lichenicola]